MWTSAYNRTHVCLISLKFLRVSRYLKITTLNCSFRRFSLKKIVAPLNVLMIVYMINGLSNQFLQHRLFVLVSIHAILLRSITFVLKFDSRCSAPSSSG
ncbi:hypothetical protein CW304_17055 [Bacillus sp. UFRGS-B20]|nr:hypothetical protein CW304_17055 [Bacillus sp. UFRGS-B20]